MHQQYTSNLRTSPSISKIQNYIIMYYVYATKYLKQIPKKKDLAQW